VGLRPHRAGASTLPWLATPSVRGMWVRFRGTSMTPSLDLRSRSRHTVRKTLPPYEGAPDGSEQPTPKHVIGRVDAHFFRRHPEPGSCLGHPDWHCGSWPVRSRKNLTLSPCLCTRYPWNVFLSLDRSKRPYMKVIPSVACVLPPRSQKAGVQVPLSVPAVSRVPRISPGSCGEHRQVARPPAHSIRVRYPAS
jgi:hypothetical protein